MWTRYMTQKSTASRTPSNTTNSTVSKKYDRSIMLTRNWDLATMEICKSNEHLVGKINKLIRIDFIMERLNY